ncbi:hypothetical protein P3T40_007330 [Paraburkholderia sp. EB58]
MALNTTAPPTPEMVSDSLARSIPDAIAVRSRDAWSQILATRSEYSSASMDLMMPYISPGARTQRSSWPVGRPEGAPSSIITVMRSCPTPSYHFPGTIRRYAIMKNRCGHAATPAHRDGVH